MERVTEKDSEDLYGFKDVKCTDICADNICHMGCPIQKAIEKLKAYEDAEEQGLLMRLQCKVGDIVYFPIYEYHDSAIITGINVCEDGIFYEWGQYEFGVDCTELWDEGYFRCEEIGKTVFLTQAEAEAALEKMKGEENA